MNVQDDPEMAARRQSGRNWYTRAASQFGLEPGQFYPFLFAMSSQARQVILNAHKLARAAIKAVNAAIRVGLTLALPDLQSAEGGEERLLQVEQEVYLAYLGELQHDDFLGVQAYTRSLIGPDGVLPVPQGAERTQMDYEWWDCTRWAYPQALKISFGSSNEIPIVFQAIFSVFDAYICYLIYIAYTPRNL